MTDTGRTASPGAAGIETFIASPTWIDAWARQAGPGERLVYARVASLPPRSIAAAKVRALAAAHKVTLTQRRAGPGLFEYEMRRKAAIRSAPAPALRQVRPAFDHEMKRVHRLLRMLANAGRPCPSNPQIAAMAGLRSPERARYVLRKLAAIGSVRTEVLDQHDPAQPRVAIFKDGTRTAVAA